MAWTIPALKATLVLLNLTSASAFAVLSMTTMTNPESKHTLFDVPVSNNGARCRVILYKKNIASSEVAITSPSIVGGLKSEEYLRMNPQGKMPTLVCNDDSKQSIAESDTISRYLMSKYPQGPSFQPDNPKSNLIARIHDMYLTTIQGCMYKLPPYGPFWTRKEAIDEYIKQMGVIEDLVCSPEEGMFLCGNEVSYADATLFPSLVFARNMLPKFGVEEPVLPPKLEAWFVRLRENDSDFSKVFDEISGALQRWEDSGRWDGFLGAGWRDEEPGTLFDKIIAGEIPAEIVKQDDKVLAFKDINPAAPAHVLVIPKDRNALTRIGKATSEHTEILGRLMVAAAEISRDKSLGFGDGARIVVNDGPDGGQEVMHLHVHVLGGRKLNWPPG